MKMHQWPTSFSVRSTISMFCLVSSSRSSFSRWIRRNASLMCEFSYFPFIRHCLSLISDARNFESHLQHRVHSILVRLFHVLDQSNLHDFHLSNQGDSIQSSFISPQNPLSYLPPNGDHGRLQLFQLIHSRSQMLFHLSIQLFQISLDSLLLRPIFHLQHLPLLPLWATPLPLKSGSYPLGPSLPARLE